MSKIKIKTCTQCRQSKLLLEFHRDKSKADGYRPRCKECRIKNSKEYYLGNKNRINRKSSVAYYENRAERLKKAKAYSLENIETMRANALSWQLSNLDKHNTNNKRWRRKMSFDPKYRLNMAMRQRLRRSIKHNKAGRHWETLVNFTVDQLKDHLEKQFTNEMSWENYGTVWEIDHKVPIAVFTSKHRNTLISNGAGH